MAPCTAEQQPLMMFALFYWKLWLEWRTCADVICYCGAEAGSMPRTQRSRIWSPAGYKFLIFLGLKLGGTSIINSGGNSTLRARDCQLASFPLVRRQMWKIFQPKRPKTAAADVVSRPKRRYKCKAVISHFSSCEVWGFVRVPVFRAPVELD